MKVVDRGLGSKFVAHKICLTGIKFEVDRQKLGGRRKDRVEKCLKFFFNY